MNKLFAVLGLAAAASASFAADKEVEDLLANMRKAYKAVGTATFSMESTLVGDNGDVAVKMTGGFKGPNLLYVDMKADETAVNVVSDGANIFAVVGGTTRVIELKYSNEALGRVLNGANLELINFYDWKRQLSTAEGDNMHDSKLSIRKSVKWNNKTWLVLEESAPTVGVYVEYYIDPKTFFVWRTVQMSIDKEFTRGDFVIKSLKTGVKIDDKKFKKPIITLSLVPSWVGSRP